MNISRGFITLTIAVSGMLFFHSLATTDFWIESAAARYYCPDPPQPDPDDLVWIPWRTYCNAAQTMSSSPDYWIIDDYPSEDIPSLSCAEIASENWQVPQEMSTGCEIERTSEFRPRVIYSLPIACNGNVTDDYYISASIERYAADYVILCPGYPSSELNNVDTGSKYFVGEPIGPNEIVEEKNLGLPQCGLSAGNPINIASGNKYQRQQDTSLPGGLEITRHYNSKDANLHPFGKGWRGSFSRHIEYILAGDPANASVTMIRDDGSLNYWRIENSIVRPPPDAKGRLELAYSNGSIIGFTYLADDSFIETYDFEGRLLSIENDRGQRLSFTYSNSLLSTITNATGRALDYAYLPDGKISQISSSGNSVWQ